MGFILIKNNKQRGVMIMKKGQGLSLDMVVIAVIVLVVLFVIIAFFSGGFTAIAEKIGNLFRGGIDDRAVSIQLCNSYCLTVKGYDSVDNIQQIRESRYCTAKFKIDKDNNGVLSDSEKENPIGCTDLGAKCIGENNIGITC